MWPNLISGYNLPHPTPRRHRPSEHDQVSHVGLSPAQVHQGGERLHPRLQAGRGACPGALVSSPLHHLPSMHGISRSPFFLVSYLVSSCSASLEEAQRVVRGARPICQPNPGFLTQLETFYPYGALAETARLRRRCGGGESPSQARPALVRPAQAVARRQAKGV